MYNGDTHQRIFISHSSNDLDVVRLISRIIEDNGLSTWASFRDISAGKIWDREIESALDSASTVVVVCSVSSVSSSYVRAEVEEALRKNKTVIPIIIDRCELPIRWKMLQWIRWDASRVSESIETLRKALPETALQNFNLLLQSAEGYDQVKLILRKHHEWLPIEHWMRSEYYFFNEPQVTSSTPVDVFAARMDSMGARGCLYYFGPYATELFTSSGRPHKDIAAFGNTITNHVDHLFAGLPPDHILAPENVFAPEVQNWRELPSNYSEIDVYFIFGRRAQFVGAYAEARKKMRANLSKKWKKHADILTFNLEMLSYDRLIER